MTALVTARSYTTPKAAQLAGVTYRQIDYWARAGVVRPSVVDGAGSGSVRLWSTDDLALLVLARLLAEACRGGGHSSMPLGRLARILDAVRPRVPSAGILVVGATSTTVAPSLAEVVLDGATVLVSFEQVHDELASAGAVSSPPAASTRTQGGGEAGPARALAEQTGPVRGTGSAREGVDAPTPPAEASSRLLNPERDAAPGLHHRELVNNSAS